jgi:hypothetical protein
VNSGGNKTETEAGDCRQSKRSSEVTLHTNDVQEKATPMRRIAFAAGYQLQRLEDGKRGLKKKVFFGKWLFRLVNLMGWKRSAKLGWRGYRIKKKLKGKKTSSVYHLNL